MSETIKKIVDYKRKCAQELFDQLEDSQKKKYLQFFKPVDELLDQDFYNVIQLFERTIEKNKKE